MHPSSTVTGKDVSLKAKGDVRLEAGENTSVTTSENKTSAASIGASFSSQGLSGLSLSASSAKGKNKESRTSYTPTEMKAAGTLKLESGKDTNILGSKAKGEKIEANVGGNLTIETLQEKETYEAKNTSAGFNLSWSMNQMLDPAGSGKILRSFSKPTIGASVSKGSLESYYRSAHEQAGIFAGKGGFDIYVEKNTDLKGAVIASEADAGKNRLSTGTFSFSDLENSADYSAKSIGAEYHHYGSYDKMSRQEKNKVYNTIGLSPNLSMPAKGDANSTTSSAVAQGTIDIRKNPTQDISALNRNTNNALNELGRIFDKQKIEEQQELAKAFGEEAFRLAHNLPDDGSGRKVAVHAIIGGIMSQITGAGFASGAIGAGVNEAIIGEIKKIKDPGTAQIVSAIVGAAAAKATGGNAGAGASAAQSGTKWNYLAEDHIPVQIGISIKVGFLGHVGIVVKTDTGSYDSADYGRYGKDIETSSGLAAPTGPGTFITRWFYDPKERYTFMINSEYIDPVKAVAAYNDQIKNNGYTQIPSEETHKFFSEVCPDVNDDDPTIDAKRIINANTQYYRNGTSDYHLTEHNCVTTTIIPILQSISYDNLSWEAKITVRQLRENLLNPTAIYTILSDDIYFFQGKGLLTNGAYGRVPNE